MYYQVGVKSQIPKFKEGYVSYSLTIELNFAMMQILKNQQSEAKMDNPFGILGLAVLAVFFVFYLIDGSEAMEEGKKTGLIPQQATVTAPLEFYAGHAAIGISELGFAIVFIVISIAISLYFWRWVLQLIHWV